MFKENPKKRNKYHIRKTEILLNILDFLDYVFTGNKKAKKDLKKRKKGKSYEQYIGSLYEKENWTVYYNGIHEGLKDHKIDLIAIKNNNILFIQCKNWKNPKYKIELNYIKSFIYNAIKYLEKNNLKNKYNAKCLIIMSRPSLDKEAYKYIKNNKFIDYKIIKY